MADVFISYKREDREWAERLDAAIRGIGFTTWWDTSLVAGEHFNEAIDRELAAARCVVVVWSDAAHQSSWVQAEAIRGFGRDILVAARIDDVALRYPFDLVQTADLRSCSVESVAEGVRAKLSGRRTAAPLPRQDNAIAHVPYAMSWRLRLMLIGAVSLVLFMISQTTGGGWQSGVAALAAFPFFAGASWAWDRGLARRGGFLSLIAAGGAAFFGFFLAALVDFSTCVLGEKAFIGCSRSATSGAVVMVVCALIGVLIAFIAALMVRYVAARLPKQWAAHRLDNWRAGRWWILGILFVFCFVTAFIFFLNGSYDVVSIYAGLVLPVALQFKTMDLTRGRQLGFFASIVGVMASTSISWGAFLVLVNSFEGFNIWAAGAMLLVFLLSSAAAIGGLLKAQDSLKQ
ncbi:MAG: toll/interleukin-1 receptor domain-containing protein [Hyphomonadaceae bacterium]